MSEPFRLNGDVFIDVGKQHRQWIQNYFLHWKISTLSLSSGGNVHVHIHASPQAVYEHIRISKTIIVCISAIENPKQVVSRQLNYNMFCVVHVFGIISVLLISPALLRVDIIRAPKFGLYILGISTTFPFWVFIYFCR